MILVRRRNNLGRYVALLASFVLVLASLLANLIEMGVVSLYLLFAATITITFFANSKNIFHISMMSGHYAFWAVPLCILMASGEHIVFGAVFICVVALLCALIMADSVKDIEWNDFKYSISGTLYIFIYILCIISVIITSGNVLVFVSLTGVITVSGALCMSNNARYVPSLVYMSMIVYVMFYSVLFWSGFGRLIIIGIMMTFTFMYFMRIGLEFVIKPILLIGVPFGTIMGTILRFGGSGFGEALRSATKDSAVTPLVLSMDIYEVSSYTGIRSISGWFDQFILLFTPLVPRMIWTSKPLGFGSQYVMDNLDLSRYSSGYTIAATLVGENVYYLGTNLAIIGILLSVGVISLMYRFLSSPKILGGYGVFVVALWLPTYYWGGMQSFSSRFLPSCLPLVAFYVVYRLYINRRLRRRAFAAGRQRGGVVRSKPGIGASPGFHGRPPTTGQ